MSVQSYEELFSHFGHNVEVASYADVGYTPANVSIECTDCNEVLLDFDREEER